MQIMACVVMILSASTAAWAFDTDQLGQGGSLTLEEIMPLIRKTPKLAGEITAELDRLGKKPEDMLCDGVRFPGAWRHLGGLRVAPYDCKFGERTLTIQARVRVTDRKGRAFERVSAAALRRAENAHQDKLTWTWETTQEAPQPEKK